MSSVKKVVGTGSTENKLKRFAEHVLGGGPSAALKWEYEQNFRVDHTLTMDNFARIVSDSRGYQEQFVESKRSELVDSRFGAKLFKMPTNEDVDDSLLSERNKEIVFWDGGKMPFQLVKLKCSLSAYIQGTNLDFNGVSFNNLPEFQLRFKPYHVGQADSVNELGEYDERIQFVNSVIQRLDIPQFRFPIAGQGSSNQRGECSISFELLMPPSFKFLDVFLFPEISASHKNNGNAFIGLKMTIDSVEHIDVELGY